MARCFTDNAVIALTALGSSAFFDANSSIDPPLYFLLDKFTNTALEEDWQKLLKEINNEELLDCARALSSRMKKYDTDKFSTLVISIIKEIHLRSWVPEQYGVSWVLTRLMWFYRFYDRDSYDKCKSIISIPIHYIDISEHEIYKANIIKKWLKVRINLRKKLWSIEWRDSDINNKIIQIEKLLYKMKDIEFEEYKHEYFS